MLVGVAGAFMVVLPVYVARQLCWIVLISNASMRRLES